MRHRFRERRRRQPRPIDLDRSNPKQTTGENAMNAHDAALVSILQAVHFEQAETLDSAGLRRHFVIEGLFEPGRIVATYTHYDRMLLLGIMPTDTPLGFLPEHAKLVGSA